MRMGPKPLR